MNDVIFGTADGKEIGKLGFVSDLDLTVDDNDYSTLLNSEPIEMTAEIDGDILRAVMTQGMYNGYVLKRDGYLNPDNGWFGDEEDTIL